MLIHGTAVTIPFKPSERLFQGLDQMGKTAQLAHYGDEPLSLRNGSRVNMIDATERALAFVSRHLSVDPD